MATAEMAFGGGLNSSSGGELKLYLKWERNTTNLTYFQISVMQKMPTLSTVCTARKLQCHHHNSVFHRTQKILKIQKFHLLGKDNIN